MKGGVVDEGASMSYDIVIEVNTQIIHLECTIKVCLLKPQFTIQLCIVMY